MECNVTRWMVPKHDVAALLALLEAIAAKHEAARRTPMTEGHP